MIHALKILPEPFNDIITGIKTFEVRYDDRDYKVGDLLALNEYDPKTDSYTGNSCIVKVVYILNDTSYCKDGFVIMSIKPCLVSEFGYVYESVKQPMGCDDVVPYATRKEI